MNLKECAKDQCKNVPTHLVCPTRTKKTRAAFWIPYCEAHANRLKAEGFTIRRKP